MVKVTATKARSEFFDLLKKSIRGHEPIAKYVVREEWLPAVDRLIEARHEYERKWDIQRKLEEWERRSASGELQSSK